MDCNIEINNIEGIDNVLDVEQVVVRGTAENCRRVKVTFTSGDVSFEEDVDVVNGAWLAEIDVENVKCNASYQVIVLCVDGENNCSIPQSGNLRCVDPECPRLDDAEIQISNDCNNDGEREVSLTLLITSPDARQVTVDFGNGIQPLLENLLPGQNQLQWQPPFEIPYVPGNYTILIASLGCPDIEIPLVIVPCGEGNPCPELISFETLIPGECDEDGERLVDVTLNINSPNAQQATIDFGNGIQQQRNLLPGNNILTWINPLAIPYQPGNYVIRIVIADCDDLTVPIEIPECPENQCPIVFGEPSVPIFICNGDSSTVIISLGYDNNSNEAIAAHIDYGNGLNQDVNLLSGDNRSVSLRSEHEPGGPYTITVSTIDSCDDLEISVDEVPVCLECPSFGDVDYSFGDCIGNRRVVIVEFGYDATHNCPILLDFGDDGSFPFVLQRGQNSIFREEIELPTNSELRGQIVVQCEDIDCDPLPLSLKTVPPCDGDGCADYELGNIIPDDDCDNNNREMEVEVTINAPNNVTINIDYGDGNEEEVRVDAGEDELIIRHTYEIGSSPTIVLQQIGLADCDPFIIELGEILACDPPPIIIPDDEERGNGEGAGCMLGRWIMVIGAAIAIISVLLTQCIPAAAAILGWIALGAGIVGAVAGVLWAIFCPKPCGWGLLISWQALLGAGVIAIYFFNCCPQLFVTGIWAITAAIGLAIVWARRCNINRCTILTEISAVLVGAVIPLASNLFNFPVLNNCMNPIIQAIVPAIAAAITLWALACHRNQNP